MALTMWCDSEGLPYEGVPVGAIKKFATGNGNASKLAMMAAMEKRGHKLQDDNEADALALLYWRLEYAANRNDQARRQ